MVSRYLMQNSKEIGYLAQHQLLDQIPELQDDIVVPDYCAMSENGEVEMNAWFGPANTISPLHRDEKHNIFCQVSSLALYYLYYYLYCLLKRQISFLNVICIYLYYFLVRFEERST